MSLKEIVVRQINHSETEEIPYTLGFQQESKLRLDEYYGDKGWRARIVPYIKPVWVMDCQQKRWIDDDHTIDIYGTVWKENNLIAHPQKPVLSEPELKGLDMPSADDFFKSGERDDAFRVLSEYHDSFTLIHIPWGIFEKSWSLRGFENALEDMFINEKFYEELAEKITDHLMGFVDIAMEYDVDGIMFGDDWGGQKGLLMGKARWKRYFKKNYLRLYDQVHKAGKKVLSHCCGNIVDILPDLIDIGLDVYESFQPEAMDIFEVKKKFGADMTFWGGLGAQSVIPFGTPRDIDTQVEILRKRMGAGGGFILAPSKDPPPETPTENLVALVESFTKGK
ncbi:MAG: uroporphyrinogen decarboxylase family protein [Clostridia bacterium]|nr:uroporphyrinogen decarboxylase family protein [Clostridia bacterium]